MDQEAGRRLRDFGSRLSDALAAQGVTEHDLTRAVRTTDAAVRSWVEGRHEPPTRAVFAIELALRLPAGTLSCILGYLPLGAVDLPVQAAILASSAITPQGKTVGLAMWETLLTTCRVENDPQQTWEHQRAVPGDAYTLVGTEDQDRTPSLADGRLGYSLREVATALGVSEDTVARLVSDGDLRAVKLGRRTIVPADAIESLLAAQDDGTELPSDKPRKVRRKPPR